LQILEKENKLLADRNKLLLEQQELDRSLASKKFKKTEKRKNMEEEEEEEEEKNCNALVVFDPVQAAVSMQKSKQNNRPAPFPTIEHLQHFPIQQQQPCYPQQFPYSIFQQPHQSSTTTGINYALQAPTHPTYQQPQRIMIQQPITTSLYQQQPYNNTVQQSTYQPHMHGYNQPNNQQYLFPQQQQQYPQLNQQQQYPQVSLQQQYPQVNGAIMYPQNQCDPFSYRP
jgi:hypothetical protein